jgi:RNA polymerase sigma-70 factor (ECF subfamily)
MQEPDRHLVARLLAGDEASFKAFFEEYFDRLFRFAMSRTRGDADLSQEAAQRAMCRAARRLDSYRGEASLFTWLAQICRNELADLLAARQRDERRAPSLDAGGATADFARRVAAPDSSDPAAVQQGRDVAGAVRAVLDELPGRYGEVLEWKYFDDSSVDQIAARLGSSFEAAQSMLARARTAFRTAMAARGWDPDTLT